MRWPVSAFPVSTPVFEMLAHTGSPPRRAGGSVAAEKPPFPQGFVLRDVFSVTAACGRGESDQGKHPCGASDLEGLMMSLSGTAKIQPVKLLKGTCVFVYSHKRVIHAYTQQTQVYACLSGTGVGAMFPRAAPAALW